MILLSSSRAIGTGAEGRRSLQWRTAAKRKPAAEATRAAAKGEAATPAAETGLGAGASWAETTERAAADRTAKTARALDATAAIASVGGGEESRGLESVIWVVAAARACITEGSGRQREHTRTVTGIGREDTTCFQVFLLIHFCSLYITPDINTKKK